MLNIHYSANNSWELVEKPIFDYAFNQHLRHHFSYLKQNLKITTSLGFSIPKSFSVLDLATGTGRVAKRFVEYGIRPENILGIDINQSFLNDSHFPTNVSKIHGSVLDLNRKFLENFPNQRVSFNLATSNMFFHLLSYEDYVSCLKQLRKHIFDGGLIMVVPHPLRDVKGIEEYHSHGVISEWAPWGEAINYMQKSVQDYLRGLHIAGFTPITLATTGVGRKVNGSFLDNDEKIWDEIILRKYVRRSPLPHYFRMWITAF